MGSGRKVWPISKIVFTDGAFRFADPHRQWDANPNDITVEGRLDGDRLTGSMTMGDGQQLTWSGTRAPSLRRAARPAWGEPVTLFSGTSLYGGGLLDAGTASGEPQVASCRTRTPARTS